MESLRKPYQGVLNIIRFNRHYYVLFIFFVIFTLIFAALLPADYGIYLYVICTIAVAATMMSLLVSFYVYDLSELYKLDWLDETVTVKPCKIVNINAGFDETSELLKEKFKNSELLVLDFYDPQRHTEISIKRARETYPPYPGTMRTDTGKILLEDNFADRIFVIFSAHEIRNDNERINFFSELNRVLKTGGKVIVTEHLRDFNNFIAYNIGFVHFYSKLDWERVFQKSKLKIQKEIRLTPFITTFILEKNGNIH